MNRKSFIRLKDICKIDYLKTTNKFVYLLIESQVEERRKLLSFFDENSIRYKKISEWEYKVYFENWVSLADLIEEEIA